MKRIAVGLTFMSVVLALVAKEKCKVIVVSENDTRPIELVITPVGLDSRLAADSLKTKLENGRFECDIETDCIESYEIRDFGELEAQGRTSRFAQFFVEDGATVTLTLDGNTIKAESNGKEFNAWNDIDRLSYENFGDEIAAIEAKGDDATDAEIDELDNRIIEWQMQYCAEHPTLGFVLDLEERLSSFLFVDKRLDRRLNIYHDNYENLYPGHPVHEKIAEQEKKGFEIFGRKFNDFQLLTLDGDTVNISEYYKDRPTLIVCWATWCLPCRGECRDIIPFFEKYRDKGLNVVAIAREFKATDNLKNAVTEDNYPWPTLLDLDDQFKVFEKLGATSSALFLLDPTGKIVASGYDISDIAPMVADMLK
ncbi:MAG: TlpA family protein disulfide reductase [Muribaculaceae bacterium]|nr:TlpA family protein disulfide reductase [Muribaculaceae bacterium]MDE6703199.1 TlpA family protein disulfide reductase [Muribaculaceae bacterium]